MISLSIQVCRKVGRSNYGSEGATCGLSGIELDAALIDDPQRLSATIRRWYSLAQAEVNHQLAEEEAAPAPPPPATKANTATHKPDYDYEPQGATDGDDDGPPPTTGSQLLGWARKQPNDAKTYLIVFGREREYPTRILDWNPNQVAAAYRAARRDAQR